MTSFDYYYYQNLSGFEFCANWGFLVNSTSMGLSNLCNKKRMNSGSIVKWPILSVNGPASKSSLL